MKHTYMNLGRGFMEYFDILNKDESRSGKIAPKGESSPEGQYCTVIHKYM